MSLEQQVASLVSATTDLTNVVNTELNSVRGENNNFKQSTLDSLGTIVATKVRSSGFTIYVNPATGLSNPVNPINNISAPFNTIAGAVAFLADYYWTNGVVIIKLSAGVHLVSDSIVIDHPCGISVEGNSTPNFSGVNAIVSQTTLANKSSGSAVNGSNANLFDHLSSIFSSCIATTEPGTFTFLVKRGNFYLSNCFLYFQQKAIVSGQNNTAIHVGATNSGQSTYVGVNNCAFMYFRYGIINRTISSLKLLGTIIISGNLSGILNVDAASIDGSQISSCFVSGNTEGILSSSSNIFSLYNTSALANDYSGIASFVSSNFVIVNCTSRDNGGYGYYIRDSGLIVTTGSDAATTGNALGKKYEQNAKQAYVVGINPT